jgi:hypothetical protein
VLFWVVTTDVRQSRLLIDGFSEDLPRDLLTLNSNITVGCMTKPNSVTWVRERNVRLSDRRLSAKLEPTFADRGVRATDPYGRILGFLDRSRYFFLSSSSSIIPMRLSRPHSRPTTSQKLWYRRQLNPDLWICSQELWPLDHRGGRCLYETAYIYHGPCMPEHFTNAEIVLGLSPVADHRMKMSSSAPPGGNIYW